MTTTTDRVKVTYGALLPPEGDVLTHTLKLRTPGGEAIEFDLDDVAVATLALFAGMAATSLKHRVGDDPDKLRAYNKDGELR